MNAYPTALPDVVVIEPTAYEDDRGVFFESYNSREFARAIGRSVQFVQDNHSRSRHMVLRGLHYQLPNPQGKLVRVTRGTIWDVAVDLRRSSPTYGQWVGEMLSAENRRQMWIPEGFAHGFVVLSEEADCLYKVTEYRCPEAERALAWNDPRLKIAWPLGAERPVLSARDMAADALGTAVTYE